MAPAPHMEGLGSERCIDSLPSGRQCPNLEVEGLDFCLKHMPEELLDEAEAITGVQRCRRGENGPMSCREYARPGVDPPACQSHTPSSIQRAHVKTIRAVASERAHELIGEFENALANPEPMTDPLGELLAVAAEMRAWKDIVRALVADLETKYRYQGKAGEQIRAEVQLYTQALRDLAVILRDIGKLDLDTRLVGIRNQTMNMLQLALTLALEKAEVPLDRQLEAREVFKRNINVISIEAEKQPEPQ